MSAMSRFDLPGLNLPLSWVPRSKSYKGPAEGEGRDLIKTALNETDMQDGWTRLPLTTLREITMMQIMNALTDKPGWEEKVFDNAIAEKWKAEAMATEDRDVTQKMMDWVIAELRWKADNFKKTGIVNVYNGDVVKSDVAISQDLKLSLRSAVEKLENIPVNRKDYHPGSDGKVLDLVHPSLFPLIYGRSRILHDRLLGLDDCIQNSGRGEVIAIPPKGEDNNTSVRRRGYPAPADPYSRKFQWLPCDVDISEPTRVTITSYINNLHPEYHPDLYSIIESVIGKAIPLWNRSLSPLIEHDFHQRINYSLAFSADPDDVSEEEKPQREANESENAYYERIWEWEENYRVAEQPEPEAFTPPKLANHIDLHKDYGHRGLQIIVKLANIELSPEKPTYDGGSWHVEGQMNEHICATALYYFDNENITESYLAFRQQSSTEDADDLGYPQGVHGWLEEVYGCENYGPGVQKIGTITCSENRLLTFPNVLQHQVQPFSLVDRSKHGHRKILALFLVDPGIRVISTANVPPQQKEWWAEEVDRQTGGTKKAIGGLSKELRDMIFEEAGDFPIAMEEAKELRLELMEERKHYSTRLEEAFEENTFSLCEH
ncbi:hypothetical protein G7Y89_g7765 [Cudoniella acicularis]|uniref:Uncharacterized protein n=1 Tax=Cudoniella acicularis TaxID=354080 RepID=A0A8H4RKC5_9HELO|nr:hypothetical protein G7Y89_g7765 [Cudoniella acicularis]